MAIQWGRAASASVAVSSERGIDLADARLPAAKRGLVLLPRRWVVERDFGWTGRFRRLARDRERLAEVPRGFHLVAFSMLRRTHVLPILGVL